MGSYRLSKNAEADLNRIWEYGLRTFGEDRADAYFWAFFEHFEMLANTPLRHPEVNDIREGYRKSLCGVDSVYYRIVDEGIEIMAVLGRQDHGQWL